MEDVGYTDLTFPLAGLNVAGEFGRQPATTTAVGQNVCVAEPITGRMRGGARFGISKWVDGQLPLNTPDGPRLVQHLAIIVDPSTDAALEGSAEYDPGQPFEDGGILDPSTNNHSNRNPGRYIRSRGSGRQPKRKKAEPGIDNAQSYTGTLNEVLVGDDCGPAHLFMIISDADGPGQDIQVSLLLCTDSCVSLAAVQAAQAMVGLPVAANPTEAVIFSGNTVVLYSPVVTE